VEAYEQILADVPEGSSLEQKMMVVIERELLIVTNKQWKIRIRGRQVVIRDLVDKAVGIFEKFKPIGSAATSIDPIHAGIPFAGVCTLLELIVNDGRQHDAALEGLDKIPDLIYL